MKVWVTKYALATGIKEMERHPDDRGEERMVMVVDQPAPNHWSLFHGNDWHLTQAAAINRAEEMRAAKIRSLYKQIAKLENLKFEAKP